MIDPASPSSRPHRATSVPDSTFDVIVSGGGPVGATAAHALALDGAKVAIIDKASFPREKACGGGLQAKLLRHLVADVRPVVRNTMSGAAFTYRLGERIVRLNGQPLVYGVRRFEFDDYLLHQASAAGSHVIEGVKVLSFEPWSANRVRVNTDKGTLYCKVLIGADGANGAVRRALNTEDAFFTQAGVYVEVPRERIDDAQLDEQLLRIDWGSLPVGYGWLFPKTETVNVGVGGPIAYARNLRAYLRRFVESERLLRDFGAHFDRLRIRGHKLPSFTARTTVSRNNVLLVGDALGLIDPFTGDGLSYGVHSARLAATHVSRWLAGDERALHEYPRAIRREIAPDLGEARVLMSFFHVFIGTIHEMFKRDLNAWDDVCGVLRGDTTFGEFHDNRLGRFRGLKPYVDGFSRMCERRWEESGSRTDTFLLNAVHATISTLVKRL